MAQRINLFKAVGKTITDITIGNYNETCIIAFDDDTFATIDATGGGDSCYFELSTEEDFDPLEFGDKKLIELEIYSFEELKTIKEERSAKAKANQEIWERTQFERLQKKYSTT
jgi:hypothetical protein